MTPTVYFQYNSQTRLTHATSDAKHLFLRLLREIGCCCQPGYRLSFILSKKNIKKFSLVPQRDHLILWISFFSLGYLLLLSTWIIPLSLSSAGQHFAVLVVHWHGNESGIILLTFCQDLHHMLQDWRVTARQITSREQWSLRLVSYRETFETVTTITVVTDTSYPWNESNTVLNTFYNCFM